jgi:hypothetical protein
MSKRAGLWIAFGGGDHADKVAASIEHRGQFTKSVILSALRPRAAELVVVSLAGTEADYIGISQKGRLTATDEVTLAVSNLVPVKGLSVEAIRKKLPPRLSFRFSPPLEGVYCPGPRVWESVLSLLAGQRGVGPRIQDLRHIIDESERRRLGYEGGIEVFERDAVASALQTWGGPSLRKRMLRGIVPDRLNPTAPFLSSIRDVSVPEDLQIVHDQVTFPGLEVARPAIVGSLTLTNRDRTEYLTILNCNRQPLEQTLGVDLIYYNHVFDSFVLVQYKLMKRRSFTEGYRPEYRPDSDKSHAGELQRMVKADEMLRSLPRRTSSEVGMFRLSGRPFYVKLCEARVKAPLDAGMTPGMYVPLGLWRRLLKSPGVRGPRGGRLITWDNCPRRFNNSEFTNLLRQGWIGSAAGQSAALREIIEEVLKSNRMLVLAATSAGRASREMRRDDLGRFAAEDDPTGAI